MSDFATAFMNRVPEVLDLFQSAPLALRVPPLSAALSAALETYQRELGAPKTIHDAEAIVITGQQPGFFTGPLYTILKAISTIHLAESFSKTMGKKVVPVFWIGADDHDFEEMRSAQFLTRNHELLALNYSPKSDVSGFPMFAVPVEVELHDFVEQVASSVTGSEFTAETSEFLHDSLSAAKNFSDWFARIMARLFRDTPLVFFTTDLPAARTLAAPAFSREILEPLLSTTALNAGGDRVRELGFMPQVSKSPVETGFFLFENGRREKVIYEHGMFQLPGTGARYSAQELLERLEHQPELFSGNVALRCIIQQELFSPSAYVAGPGEIAYWGQFKPLFERFQQPMPLVYSRCHAQLGSLKLSKLRGKFGLTTNELLKGPDAALEIALAHSAESGSVRVIREQRTNLLGIADALTTGLENERATQNLLDMAQSFRQQLADSLGRLESAALRQDTHRVQTIQQQIQRLCSAFAPHRKPQERVLNICSWLFEHGWELVPRLLAELDTNRFDMQEIEL